MIYILSTIRKSPLFQVLLRQTFMLCMCIFRDSAFGLSLMIHLIFFLPRWSPHLFFTFVFRFQVSKSLWSGFKIFSRFSSVSAKILFFAKLHLRATLLAVGNLNSRGKDFRLKVFSFQISLWFLVFRFFRYLSGFRVQQICISVQLLRRPRRGCCCRKPHPAMSLIFGCWQQIKIRNTNQLSWAIN